MGSLYASDILWTQVGVPEIDEGPRRTRASTAQKLPPGTSCPRQAPDWLDQNKLVRSLRRVSGPTPTTGGTHGLQLDSTSIGDTTLTRRRPTNVARTTPTRSTSQVTRTRATPMRTEIGGHRRRRGAPADRSPAPEGGRVGTVRSRSPRCPPRDRDHGRGPRQPGPRRAGRRQQLGHLHGHLRRAATAGVRPVSGPESRYLGPAAPSTRTRFAGAVGEVEIEGLPAASVYDAIVAVSEGDADRALVPFENSIEGAVRSHPRRLGARRRSA